MIYKLHSRSFQTLILSKVGFSDFTAPVALQPLREGFTEVFIVESMFMQLMSLIANKITYY